MSNLEAIKERTNSATEGPWVYDGDVNQDYSLATKTGPHEWERTGIIPGEYVRPNDAEFIANARTDIPKLITALEAFERWARSLETHSDILDLDPEQVAEHVRKIIREALA